MLFAWSVWVALHQGTAYTNFLFLANTRTNLAFDLDLDYADRELVVNLLLFANAMGAFVAQAVSAWALVQYYPIVVDNMPD